MFAAGDSALLTGFSFGVALFAFVVSAIRLIEAVFAAQKVPALLRGGIYWHGTFYPLSLLKSEKGSVTRNRGA